MASLLWEGYIRTSRNESEVGREGATGGMGGGGGRPRRSPYYHTIPGSQVMQFASREGILSDLKEEKRKEKRGYVGETDAIPSIFFLLFSFLRDLLHDDVLTSLSVTSLPAINVTSAVGTLSGRDRPVRIS